MIVGVDSSELGATDAGADRDSRERDRLCRKYAWCTEHDNHPGPCRTPVPRDIPVSDFGPEASKKRRY